MEKKTFFTILLLLGGCYPPLGTVCFRMRVVKIFHDQKLDFLQNYQKPLEIPKYPRKEGGLNVTIISNTK